MSSLRPAGTCLMIGGEEHRVFFSLGVIDELQSRFGKTVGQLLVMLKDPVEGPGYLREILTALLNDEGIRLKNGKRYTKEEVGSLVMQKEIPGLTISLFLAFNDAMPEPEDERNDEESELLDIAQLLIIATSKMGYSEEEIFNMTPKKFFTLFEKYLELNGKKKDTRAAIDMLP